MTSNEKDTEHMVGQLVGIGRAWAKYGLQIGKSALETSAATLKTTADVLGEISERVAKEKAAAKDDGAEAEKSSRDAA